MKVVGFFLVSSMFAMSASDTRAGQTGSSKEADGPYIGAGDIRRQFESNASNPSVGVKSAWQGALTFHIGMEMSGVDEAGLNSGMKRGGKESYATEGRITSGKLPGWEFGFSAARDAPYTGSVFYENHKGKDNIASLYARRTYDMPWGNVGWRVNLAAETVDDRLAPDVMGFGKYKITQDLEIHGYGLAALQRKGGRGNFLYWEVEPGLGYQFSKNVNGWLNVHLQGGDWQPCTGLNNEEFEAAYLVKPGISYNWGKLTTAFWSEIGLSNKKAQTGHHLNGEKFIKVGTSLGYDLTDYWRVFGEVSFRVTDVDPTSRSNVKTNLAYGMVGATYNFK